MPNNCTYWRYCDRHSHRDMCAGVVVRAWGKENGGCFLSDFIVQFQRWLEVVFTQHVTVFTTEQLQLLKYKLYIYVQMLYKNIYNLISFKNLLKEQRPGEMLQNLKIAQSHCPFCKLYIIFQTYFDDFYFFGWVFLCIQLTFKRSGRILPGHVSF